MVDLTGFLFFCFLSLSLSLSFPKRLFHDDGDGRRTGPREGEIQIDCRRNGYHFRRIGWLLNNKTPHVPVQKEKQKQKHQTRDFFINYTAAAHFTPLALLFLMSSFILLPHTNIEQPAHMKKGKTSTTSIIDKTLVANRSAQCISFHFSSTYLRIYP